LKEDSEIFSQYAVFPSLFQPRLERLEKDLDLLHSRTREFDQDLQSTLLVDADLNRRLDSLERIYAEQRSQQSVILTDTELMKASVQDLREKMINVVEGLNVLARKFDEQRQDIRGMTVTADFNHSKRTRLLVTVAGLGAAIAIILNQLYSVLTGENILSSLLGPIKFLFTGS
jgi:chromosome segregation ATPase